jgi:hypothetical protein
VNTAVAIAHRACIHPTPLSGTTPTRTVSSQFTGSTILYLQQQGVNTVAGNQAFFQRTNSVPALPRITTFQFALIPSLYPTGPITSLVQLFATLNVSFAGNSPLDRHPALQGRNPDSHASQSRLFAILSPEGSSIPTTTQLALKGENEGPAVLSPDAATPASPASARDVAVGLLSVVFGWMATLLM